jgi:hypothetical protein
MQMGAIRLQQDFMLTMSAPVTEKISSATFYLVKYLKDKPNYTIAFRYSDV